MFGFSKKQQPQPAAAIVPVGSLAHLIEQLCLDIEAQTAELALIGRFIRNDQYEVKWNLNKPTTLAEFVEFARMRVAFCNEIVGTVADKLGLPINI